MLEYYDDDDDDDDVEELGSGWGVGVAPPIEEPEPQSFELEHDTEKEWRVFGPPGTGKTTWATAQIAAAAKKYGGKRVLACSFTKTAASELVARLKGDEVKVPRHNVGTIHSLCYQALGRPTLAETKIAEWNDRVDSRLRISRTSVDRQMDEGDVSIMDKTSDTGDALLSQYNFLRNKLVPLHEMPWTVREFAEKWEEWKEERELMDFTDLLAKGGMGMLYAPNNASICFVDEAQDLTPLQFAVVRHWARSLVSLIFLADDDQAIFSFTGGSPDSLIDPTFPSSNKIVLEQSHRVPHAVHAHAVKWAGWLKHREPKEYKPMEREGSVIRLPQATYKNPAPAIRHAAKRIEEGRSVMLLASCSYMLKYQILPQLKEARIPFWNPYRETQGEWNPINGARRRKIQNFLNPNGQSVPIFPGATLWDLDQLEDWLPLISSSHAWLKRGAKEALKRVRKADRPLDALLNWYCDYFLSPGLDEALLSAASGSTDWLQAAMPSDKAKSWEYTFEVLKRCGNAPPRCVVGTIHSVKGGEADTVILFPDVSQESYKTIHTDIGHDSIIRLFYVGMTRAKDELVICGPATSFKANI